MLDASLEVLLDAGSNPASDPETAAWIALLPRLDLSGVAVLGRPATGVLRVVEEMGWPSVESAEADLIVVGRGAGRRSGRDAVDSCRRTAAVYLDPAVRAALRPGDSHLRLVAGTRPHVGGLPGRPSIATPWPGAGLRTPTVLEPARSLARRALRRGGRDPSRLVLAAGAASSADGALLLPATVDPFRLPGYILELAAGGPAPLDDHSWALLAGGEYWSQKLVFLAFPPGGGDQPDVAVKVSRVPSFSGRLLNELRGLESLAGASMGEGVAPDLLFGGTHHGIAVVGERALTGASFVDATDGSPSCPVLAKATSALECLARDTIRPTTHEERHRALAALSKAMDRAGLRAEVVELRPYIDVLERVDPGTVFQHGDAGPLNLVVLPDGRIGFHDWENADPEGLPLWDVLYLFHTMATRARRDLDPLAAFHDLFGRSAWREALGAVASRARRDLGVPVESLAALIVVFFAHQALKERSRVGGQGRAPYRTVLHAALARGPELASALS